MQGLAVCFLVYLLGATDPGGVGFRVVAGGGVMAHKLRRTKMNLDGDTSPIEPALAMTALQTLNPKSKSKGHRVQGNIQKPNYSEHPRP